MSLFYYSLLRIQFLQNICMYKQVWFDILYTIIYSLLSNIKLWEVKVYVVLLCVNAYKYSLFNKEQNINLWSSKKMLIKLWFEILNEIS